MIDEKLLRRKWFGGRDTGHLSFTEAVDVTMEKKYAWVKLTDEEIWNIAADYFNADAQYGGVIAYSRAIEAKLEEKNL